VSEQAVPPAGGAPRGGAGGAGGGRDAYDTIGDPHRQEVSSVKRRLYILVVLAAALAAAR
jgi:two-component system C4-dicarboxylate transport sensor histidine kinase DctB